MAEPGIVMKTVPLLRSGMVPAQRPVPLPELREALAAARIRTRYQPIVRMRDRTLVAMEVLARLEHPIRGIVAPDLFVPQYEAAGLAWPLTEAVVRRAFAEWTDARLDRLGVSLALNFPLDVLLIPSALRWLDEQRQDAGIDFQLEIQAKIDGVQQEQCLIAWRAVRTITLPDIPEAKPMLVIVADKIEEVPLVSRNHAPSRIGS